MRPPQPRSRPGSRLRSLRRWLASAAGWRHRAPRPGIRSLRARLALAAALAITLALGVAALGLVALFERHVERRIGAELVSRLNGLAAALTLAPDGAPRLDPAPTDPRYDQPLSGLYWQIDAGDGAAIAPGVLRSRSLWDAVLAVPADLPDPGAIHAHVLPGPDGRPLLLRERRLLLPGPAGVQALRLSVATDRAELTRARAAFAVDMLPYLALIAVLLALATAAQLRLGLRPLRELRREVAAIRDGARGRLTDTYPDEVMPLVSEVNALLAAREQAVTRARAWTADLAHGLKTPLAALAADAARLRAEGQPVLADDLEHLATAMRRRVERELIRARLRAGGATGGDGPADADPAVALHGLLRTLQRTPDGERLDWLLDAPTAPPVVAPVALPADDLMELLGNLLENAAKWARARVTIRLRVTAGPPGVELLLADDGPGVPAGQRARLGERGLRLDEQKAGNGLGLAIARDIVDAYGGRIGFEDAPGGGLLVRLWLPAARRAG